MESYNYQFLACMAENAELFNQQVCVVEKHQSALLYTKWWYNVYSVQCNVYTSAMAGVHTSMASFFNLWEGGQFLFLSQTHLTVQWAELLTTPAQRQQRHTYWTRDAYQAVHQPHGVTATLYCLHWVVCTVGGGGQLGQCWMVVTVDMQWQ